MKEAKKIKEFKKAYFGLIEQFTPETIKKNPIIDLEKEQEIELAITKKLIEELKIEEWLKNYKKEAKVSTAGIRGVQNVLYYWDTRFPMNQLGIALATVGKALVLKDKIKNRTIHKIVSGEVRYNTKKYIELISRIQSGFNIHTHLSYKNKSLPVWLVSFIIFLLDYDGGEYVTPSHAISSKIATKDLDDEGSQFSPEVSLEFVSKIESIIKEVKKTGKNYKIKLSSKNNLSITEDFDGYDVYVSYLRKNIAIKENIAFVKKEGCNGFRLMFDFCGGCMYQSMKPILKKLDIVEIFDWNHKEEDPFFHGIGKVWRDNVEAGTKEFFDLSCDATLIEVVKTMGYEEVLKNKPLGYVVLITDPDGDRLVVGQIESSEKINKIKDLGIHYIQIDNNKIFVVYHPTHSFLMIMDFYMEQLKRMKLWDNYPRFMITTAPSSRSWDEWGISNKVKVITTPVGFKEIALVMKKVEGKIIANSDKEIVINDIFNKKVNLGKNPRLVFAGEESGGMITGPEDLITSKNGRIAIAMREKSAGDSSIIATFMSSHLHREKKFFSEYLEEIFEKNKIKNRYFIREEIIYYNENEADPEKLKKSKLCGERKRDKLDTFYLGLALGLREKIISFKEAKKILLESFNHCDLSSLERIIFVGDGTYFKFNDMFIEIRRSGTDAKMKGYACGSNEKKCKDLLKKFLYYNGERNSFYNKLIPSDFQKEIYDLGLKIYLDYFHKDL